MTLRQKTLLLVVTAVGALVAGLFVAARLIVHGSVADAERRDIVAEVARARDVVTAMAQEFGDRSSDWSDWDDTATFLADSNQGYVDSNVVFSSFTSIGWDLFMVVHADGTPVVAVARDPVAGALIAPPPGLQAYLPLLLRDAASHGPPIAGLGLVDGQPMLLSSRPIRNSDKSLGRVPGRLIIGHVIDPAWIARLARFTSLDLALIPTTALADAPAIDQRMAIALGGHHAVRAAPTSEQVMAGWTYLRDLDGQPIALMRIERDRAIRAHGQDIVRAATIAIVLGGALVAIAVLILTGRGVLRPLARLIAAARLLERGERTRVSIANRDELGELAGAFNQMAQVIADREESLRAARARTRLVLDSTGDALITCSLRGQIDGEVSAAARAWFGEPEPGADVAAYLAGSATETVRALRLGLDQIADDLLPFEVAVDQLLKRLIRDGRRYALSYRRIEGAAASLLVVVTDVTALAEAEAAEAAAREAHEVVAHVLRAPVAFERFLDDVEALLARALAATTAAERAHALHTLKGNAAVFGMASVAAAAHHVEDRLAEGADAAEASAGLVTAWRAAVARTADHRRRDQPAIQLTVAEHAAFMRRLVHDDDRAALLRTVRSWRLAPVRPILERLAHHARRIADGRGKPVDVVVDTDSARVDVHATAELWNSLVHVVRNAIDHGVDDPADRVAAGKPARFQLRLAARDDGGALRIAISDDGAGIDWDRLISRARERGLILGADEREAALFADGVSTRAQVSELSGRGIGLGAVRAACDALAVRIDVVSRPGAGTTFGFLLGGVAHRAAA